MTCCGKLICSGCFYAPVYDNQGNRVTAKTCPFCRTLAPNTDEEMIKREKKRMEANDAIAMHNHGINYSEGIHGYRQDRMKALEFWCRAGELGHTKSYNNIGYAYKYGEGVEIDEEKAKHYYKLSAMGGNVKARYNLGNHEASADDMERALKHYMIAA